MNNFCRDFQALTLDVIGRIAFAVDSKCQLDPNDEFLFHGQEFFNTGGFEQSYLLQIAAMLPEWDWFWSLFRGKTQMGEHENWLCNGLERILAKRKTDYKVRKKFNYKFSFNCRKVCIL